MRDIIENFFLKTNTEDDYAYPVSVSMDVSGQFDYVHYSQGFDVPGWGTGHIDNNHVVIDS